MFVVTLTLKETGYFETKPLKSVALLKWFIVLKLLILK